jgi:tartrate dehydrogenase/decarboxylase/D-malate dehydrogenase
MMLDFLGLRRCVRAIVAAIEGALADDAAPRTRDIGGKAGTVEVGKAIAALL